MRNISQIQIEGHQEEEYVLTFMSSTPEKKTFTLKEVESIKRSTEKSTKYKIFLKLEPLLNPDQLKLVQTTLDISDSTKSRIKQRNANNEPLEGKKRGRIEGTQLKLNRETIMWIKNKIDKNKSITAETIRAQLVVASSRNNRLTKNVSETTIKNVIKKLGYSRKRLTKQPIDRNTDLAK